MDKLQSLFDQLKGLTAIPATSGFEQEIARQLVEEMRPMADRVEVDAFGNVYGYMDCSPNGLRVMVLAHTDSVGMIVSHIEPDGYLRLDVVGAVPANLVYAQRVRVMTPEGPRVGVVGAKPGHIAFRDAAMATSVPPPDALFIDVGASSWEEVRAMRIEPGQQITWDSELAWLGDPANGLVTGRSLDDRVGLLAMLETMRNLREPGGRPEANMIFVGAVQEEIGLRGAIQAGNLLTPDLCIGIDATISQAGFGHGIAPSPSTAYSEAPTILGGGPAISIMDRGLVGGLVGHPALIAHCRAAADREGIPYQLEGSLQYITSDAAAVQFAGRGVPSVTVKIPSRYTHGPVEVCSLKDVVITGDLVAAAIRAIGPTTKFDFLSVGQSLPKSE
jgi:putative aminopeptidase FrvX